MAEIDRRAPNREAQQEFDRREEWVRAVVVLRRGQIEDLELLVRHRNPKANRSQIVRDAVGWLLAREAMQLIRARDIESRQAEREAREAEAIAYSRREREARDQERELSLARAIVKAASNPPGGVG